MSEICRLRHANSSTQQLSKNLCYVVQQNFSKLGRFLNSLMHFEVHYCLVAMQLTLPETVFKLYIMMFFFFLWMKLLLGYGPKSSEFFHLNLYWTSSTSCGVIWRNNIVIVTHIQVQRHVSTVRRLTLKSRSQCVRTRLCCICPVIIF